MNPKISIIVPIYNVENFIHECIASILNQTFEDLELILVNDGSTDRSGIICDEYSKQDNRVVVIHKENEGQSAARNKGIEAAKGDYIGFVDGDDWIHHDMYHVLYTKAIETNAEITACNLMQYNQDSTSHMYCNKINDCLYDRDSAMNELFLNERLTFSPCNKLYKRVLFEDIKFKDGYILEDIDFSYRIIHQAHKIFYTGAPLYHYRYNDNSTMRKEFSKKRLDEFEVRKSMYSFYRHYYPNVANELYADCFLAGLMLYINIKKYYRNEKKQYKYLLNKDRKILGSLLFKKDYNRKKKFLLLIAIISPSILAMFYYFYWEKIKKAL